MLLRQKAPLWAVPDTSTCCTAKLKGSLAASRACKLSDDKGLTSACVFPPSLGGQRKGGTKKEATVCQEKVTFRQRPVGCGWLQEGSQISSLIAGRADPGGFDHSLCLGRRDREEPGAVRSRYPARRALEILVSRSLVLPPQVRWMSIEIRLQSKRAGAHVMRSHSYVGQVSCSYNKVSSTRRAGIVFRKVVRVTYSLSGLGFKSRSKGRVDSLEKETEPETETETETETNSLLLRAVRPASEVSSLSSGPLAGAAFNKDRPGAVETLNS